MAVSRRKILASALAAPLLVRSGLMGSGAARAAGKTVIRFGTLKLIHAITPYFYPQFMPPGYDLQIIPFENPSDGKDAVVTKSVDFGTFGIAAAIFGAVAHQPVVVYGSECDKGMAVVAGIHSGIAKLADLRGKRVAIWPGSTQEVFILERLRMEGMSVKDLQPVRVSFSEMPAALAHGDVDAYVGAEPGPSLSVTSGIGRIVEYPYGTAMGSLNMVVTTHRDTIAEKPDLVAMMLKLQRDASQFAMAHPADMAAMTVAKLGMNKTAVSAAVANVELNWQMTPQMISRTKSYAEQMLAMKQIRALPDFSTLLDTKFSDSLAA